MHYWQQAAADTLTDAIVQQLLLNCDISTAHSPEFL
jgi:hypothetical protein